MPSMRLNTQAVVPKADNNVDWHVVGESRGKQGKRGDGPTKSKSAATNGASNSQGQSNGASQSAQTYSQTSGSSVFAAMDQAWMRQQGKGSTEQDTNGFAALEKFEVPPVMAAAATVSPADSASDSPKQRAKPAKPADRAKPSKLKQDKPAPRKAPAAAPREVSVAALAAEVDVEGFKEFAAALEVKHEADEVLQLQCVQDFLRSVFATASLHFTSMLQSTPVSAAAARPWLDLPGPLRQALSRFVGGKSSDALSAFLCQACEALVTGLPERGAGGPAAKVEVLVMVSAILRMRPALALVPACDTLSKAGVRMLAPGRLPTTLWILEQASLASGGQGVGSAVHAWCRIILPGLVLAEVPCSSCKKSKAEKVGGYQLEAESRTLAIDYILNCSTKAGVREAAAAGLDMRQAGKPTVAVVPAAAVSEIAAVLHGSGRRAGVSRDTPALLARIEPKLQSLALATSEPHHVSALVVRSLEAADGCSDEALEQHTRLLVALLVRHATTTVAVWSSKHKPLIRGSRNVLQLLAANRALLSPLLALDDGASTLLATLGELSAKQSSLVKSAKSSASRDMAREAQATIDTLVASNSVQSGGGSALLSLVVLAMSVIGVPILIDRNPEVAQKYLGGILGADTSESIISFCKHGVAYCINEVPAAFARLSAQLQAQFQAASAKLAN